MRPPDHATQTVGEFSAAVFVRVALCVRGSCARFGLSKLVRWLMADQSTIRRGAIRTPAPGFKVQGPATRRPGITLSALLAQAALNE